MKFDTVKKSHLKLGKFSAYQNNSFRNFTGIQPHLRWQFETIYILTQQIITKVIFLKNQITLSTLRWNKKDVSTVNRKSAIDEGRRCLNIENLQCQIQRHNFRCNHTSRNVRKRTTWHVHPSNTQISLRICAVWSESSLSEMKKTLHTWVSKTSRKHAYIVLTP